MSEPAVEDSNPFGCFALLAPFLFIATVALPLVNMGFRPSHTGPPPAEVFRFTTAQVWAINLALGAVAGVMIAPKRFVVAAVAGLAGAAAVTGSAQLYFSWRQSIEAIEMLLPLGIGTFVSVQLFNRLSPDRSDDEGD